MYVCSCFQVIMIWFHEFFSQFVTEPLTNGNHIEQEEGESNPIDLFKEHLATKPKSPADSGMWPRNIYQEVTQPFTYFCLLTEPATIPNESKSRKNSASSSSRAKSGSSRPHTGYGKNRTSTDEQVNDSGKWLRNNYLGVTQPFTSFLLQNLLLWNPRILMGKL